EDGVGGQPDHVSAQGHHYVPEHGVAAHGGAVAAGVHTACVPVLQRDDLEVRAVTDVDLHGLGQIGRASCRERGGVWGGGQAEDGIRDRNVTGVQTCALPILKTASGVNRTTSPPRVTTTCRSTASRPTEARWLLACTLPASQSCSETTLRCAPSPTLISTVWV